VRPEDATAVADAIVRVYIDHGDRTDRNKARLKYLLDAWGIEKFIAHVEDRLGRMLVKVVAEAIEPAPPQSRSAHIGVHGQKQEGLNWIGIVLPVGRLSAAQMRGIAQIARDLGDGDSRLTVWQNLLISGVRDENVAAAKAGIAAVGLTTEATPVRAGLVACTGNIGCKFAASDTKRHADEIATWCEARVALHAPVNIHLTGCHHSCAQHYISDIGLLACKIEDGDDGDRVEGYHVHIGGGFGPQAALGRQIYRDVKAEDAPRVIERMLQGYLHNRASPDESFLAFARRHEIDALQAMFAAGGAE
jgi:ferredoxin-nitrite reductase